jgi:hypothetical protein
MVAYYHITIYSTTKNMIFADSLIYFTLFIVFSIPYIIA